MYYFHLQDHETIIDFDGTELVDLNAARVHAAGGVARALTSNSGGILKQDWSEWTLSVRDELGTELFSFAMSGFWRWQFEEINAVEMEGRLPRRVPRGSSYVPCRCAWAEFAEPARIMEKDAETSVPALRRDARIVGIGGVSR